MCGIKTLVKYVSFFHMIYKDGESFYIDLEPNVQSLESVKIK